MTGLQIGSILVNIIGGAADIVGRLIAGDITEDQARAEAIAKGYLIEETDSDKELIEYDQLKK